MTHLHRDYHTSWCGLDATHIPMSYAAKEADCAKCHGAKASAEKQAEKDAADAKRRAKADAEKAVAAEAKHLQAAKAEADAKEARLKAIEDRLAKLEAAIQR